MLIYIENRETICICICAALQKAFIVDSKFQWLMNVSLAGKTNTESLAFLKFALISVYHRRENLDEQVVHQEQISVQFLQY